MRWVTRPRSRVNRTATPWLIRRFVDPSAEILFVAADEVARAEREQGAVGFGAPGAHYPPTDARGRCSFEALAEEHRPNDAALRRLARIVHGADLPDLAPPAESAGLRAISAGFSDVARDDSKTVDRAAFPYDALHVSLQRSQDRDAAAGRA